MWADDAVDSATACWLISEVFRTGSGESKMEAADLLDVHAGKLVRSAQGDFSWPASILDRWPAEMPIFSRTNILTALVRLLCSRPKEWWVGYEHWFLAMLDDARRRDPDFIIRDTAATFLKVILSAREFDPNEVALMGKEERSIASVEQGLAEHGEPEGWFSRGRDRGPELEAWAQGPDGSS